MLEEEKHRMKKSLLSLLSVLVMATLLVSPVSAGRGIGFSATFSLGSLIAEGFATGVGNTDVTFELTAFGPADITCINNGSNSVPGQSSPRITASGRQDVLGSDPRIKNGRTPFLTETDDPETVTWDVGGCPSPNWTGHVDFIYWTNATISVYATDTGAFLIKHDYVCETARYPEPTVSCTLVN
jgi:hypothetical protein